MGRAGGSGARRRNRNRRASVASGVAVFAVIALRQRSRLLFLRLGLSCGLCGGGGDGWVLLRRRVRDPRAARQRPAEQHAVGKKGAGVVRKRVGVERELPRPLDRQRQREAPVGEGVDGLKARGNLQKDGARERARRGGVAELELHPQRRKGGEH